MTISDSDYSKIKEESYSNLSHTPKIGICKRSLFDTIQTWIDFEIHRNHMTYNQAIKYLITKHFSYYFSPKFIYEITHNSNTQWDYSYHDIINVYIKIFHEYEEDIIKNNI